MISDSPLPADLVKLFRDDGAAGRTLSVPLPPGRTVMSSEEAFGRPVYWLTYKYGISRQKRPKTRPEQAPVS